MQCQKCHKELSGPDWIASISGSILGDECTDVYYLCPVCGVYSVESCRDDFTGIETSSVKGPLTKAEGDALVEIIRRCAEPWDKKCRCEAHRRYFNDTLD